MLCYVIVVTWPYFIFKDARPEKEFVVSRIPGAERVDPDNLIEGLARAEDCCAILLCRLQIMSGGR